MEKVRRTKSDVFCFFRFGWCGRGDGHGLAVVCFVRSEMWNGGR